MPLCAHKALPVCCPCSRRYQKEGPLRGTDAPVVGVLLYRKHVITEQPYIHQLITQMEEVLALLCIGGMLPDIVCVHVLMLLVLERQHICIWECSRISFVCLHLLCVYLIFVQIFSVSAACIQRVPLCVTCVHVFLVESFCVLVRKRK